MGKAEAVVYTGVGIWKASPETACERWSWPSSPCLPCPPPPAAQVDWARAYEDGVEAFKKGNDALAEQKSSRRATTSGHRNSRARANFPSIVYKPFIPDFYLGVIRGAPGPLSGGAGAARGRPPRRPDHREPADEVLAGDVQPREGAGANASGQRHTPAGRAAKYVPYRH